MVELKRAQQQFIELDSFLGSVRNKIDRDRSELHKWKQEFLAAIRGCPSDHYSARIDELQELRKQLRETMKSRDSVLVGGIETLKEKRGY